MTDKPEGHIGENPKGWNPPKGLNEQQKRLSVVSEYYMLKRQISDYIRAKSRTQKEVAELKERFPYLADYDKLDNASEGGPNNG